MTKPTNLALWILQLLLAVIFAKAGAMKTCTPMIELATQMHWVYYTPEGAVRLLGYLEIMGAFGLIFPAATRVWSIVTPIAALCLAVLMGLAVIVHLVHDESSAIGIPLALAMIALVVAWGRFRIEPIQTRY